MGICRSLIGVGNYNNPMYIIKNGKVDMNEDCKTDTFVRYYVSHIAKNYDRFYTQTAKEIAKKHKAVDMEFFNSIISLVNDNCKELDKLSEILK